jgi:hypothetical protein
MNRIRMHARRLAWVALLLGGCGPGSGGSGVPENATGVAPPATSPAPTAPGGGMADATCAAPAGATSAPYTGSVQAVSETCLLVEDRAIVIHQAQIVRRSGAMASRGDLVPGVRVTIEPESADPGRASLVIVEDVNPD